MVKKIRIGCASAFYGDSQLSARQLVDKGKIDYLVFDYLAEATMAILSRAQAKNAALGYATDFVTVAMRDVLADCAKKNIKVVANAGGVNVPACIAALRELIKELGLDLKVAGVYGDDLSGLLKANSDIDLASIEKGEPLPEKLASINAYLGSRPIADALAAGADIVVTGRVVDSAVVLGPLMHEFLWQENQYEQLAQGALAGHIIECGAQCTGGNFTDWHLVPDFSNMSYPIVEVVEDGSFMVSIPPETGGLVSVASVGEQVLYEIGDPANYLLPDVACDFSYVQLEQVAKDLVKVTGATGRAPGNQYKVCATYIDGYRLTGTFYMGGLRVADKARASLEAWVKRTQKFFAEQGWEDYRQVSIEIIGAEDTYGPHGEANKTREAMGKFGLHHNSREALEFAAAEMAYLATSGPPGMSGFGAGRSRAQPLMRVHSALIDKALVPVKVQLGDNLIAERTYQTASESVPKLKCQLRIEPLEEQSDWLEVPLVTIAYARSGDKGNDANVGVMARKPEYMAVLNQQVTAQVVEDYFFHLLDGYVERFCVPGFNAFNFLMTEALGGGGTASIRVDSQGKAFGQMLLSMLVRVPPDWLNE